MSIRTHIQYMKKCVELGKEALLKGNPPVGAILVKDDSIIGLGQEAGKSSGDITKHAEIESIRDALKIHQSLKGSTLYTTHEPCIMCSYVIRHHQIKKIVFGVSSEFVGGITSEFKILETENVPKWNNAPIIVEGILENECLALSEKYQTIQNFNK